MLGITSVALLTSGFLFDWPKRGLLKQSSDCIMPATPFWRGLIVFLLLLCGQSPPLHPRGFLQPLLGLDPPRADAPSRFRDSMGLIQLHHSACQLRVKLWCVISAHEAHDIVCYLCLPNLPLDCPGPTRIFHTGEGRRLLH